MSADNPNARLVAKSGFFTGLHPGMGIAAKVKVVAFVLFTVLNVEFAGGICGTIRGWIETGLSWYSVSAVMVLYAPCIFLMCSKWARKAW